MSHRVRFVLYRPIVIFADVLLVNAGFLLAFYIRWGHLAARPQNIRAYQHLAVLISVITMISFHLLDLYRDWLRRSLRHVIYSIIIAITMTVMTTMALGFWSRQFAFPRSVLVLAGIIQVLLVSAYRMQMRRQYRRWFGNRRTVVVAETPDAALMVAEKFQDQSRGLYAIERSLTRPELQPPYEQLDHAETVVLTQGVDDKSGIILHCFRQKKEVLVVPNLSELTVFGAETREVDDLLIFGIRPHRLNPAEELLKRMMDLVGSLTLLVLSSPVLVLVAVLVRLTSKGPALFRQERVGANCKAFRIIKFRTMVADAEEQSGPVLASESDPRITRLGRFLRAARIDELPQLFNVLKGDMSLVGPRPERAFFVEQFERECPAYELRHTVKPGLTGLAQVVGRYSTTVERKLHFDLLYIYNYSLLLDLKILLQTIRVVLQREQATGLASEKTLRRQPRTTSIRAVEDVMERASVMSHK
jgi:exopolysaccharide biosynthesis polyprenyl glycosylphosphotransferase